MLFESNQDLSFVPRTHIKQLDVVAHTYNPGTEEVRTDRCLGLTDTKVVLCLYHCTHTHTPQHTPTGTERFPQVPSVTAKDIETLRCYISL